MMGSTARVLGTIPDSTFDSWPLQEWAGSVSFGALAFFRLLLVPAQIGALGDRLHEPALSRQDAGATQAWLYR